MSARAHSGAGPGRSARVAELVGEVSFVDAAGLAVADVAVEIGADVLVDRRAEEGWVYRRGQFDAIVAPTLLLTGSESVPVVTKATELAAAAIRAAEIRVLQGQAHLAHKADTGVAEIIGRFIALRARDTTTVRRVRVGTGRTRDARQQSGQLRSRPDDCETEAPPRSPAGRCTLTGPSVMIGRAAKAPRRFRGPLVGAPNAGPPGVRKQRPNSPTHDVRDRRS